MRPDRKADLVEKQSPTTGHLPRVAQACGEGAGPCVLPKIEGCATGAGLDYTMLSGCVGDKRRASRLQHEFGACVAPRRCLEPSGGPDCSPSRDDRLECLSPEPPRVPCGRSRAHAERPLVCAMGGGRGQAAQKLRGAGEARVQEVHGREQAGGVRQSRGRDGGRRCLHLERCRMPRRVVSAALPRPARRGEGFSRWQRHAARVTARSDDGDWFKPLSNGRPASPEDNISCRHARRASAPQQGQERPP